MPFTPSPLARLVSTTQIGPNLVAFTYCDESVAVARTDNEDVILFSAPEKERVAMLFLGAPLPDMP